MGNALNAAFDRIRKTEAAITSVQANVDPQVHTIKVLLSRASASTGTAPPAASASDAALLADIDPATLHALVREFINANGKRTLTDDDVAEDSAKRHSPGVIISPLFSFAAAPAAPDSRFRAAACRTCACQWLPDRPSTSCNCGHVPGRPCGPSPCSPWRPSPR
jgi:hypothetical protein